MCEVCGLEIKKRAYRVKIEGSVLMTCRSCSKLGEVVEEINLEISMKTFQRRTKKLRPVLKPVKKQIYIERRTDLLEYEGYSVVKNYGLLIRRAREKRKLKQEELASLVNEKLSLIRKIEAEKQKPPIKLAKKLENLLSIKLIEPTPSETEKKLTVPWFKQGGLDLTIGDIVKIKRKK